MNWFRNINMASLAIIVGGLSAIGWIVFSGTLPLVISIVAGSLIALKATMGND